MTKDEFYGQLHQQLSLRYNVPELLIKNLRGLSSQNNKELINIQMFYAKRMSDKTELLRKINGSLEKLKNRKSKTPFYEAIRLKKIDNLNTMVIPPIAKKINEYQFVCNFLNSLNPTQWADITQHTEFDKTL